MFILPPFEDFSLRLLSECPFDSLWVSLSSFWWKSGHAMPISCLVSFFHFLCSHRGQCQQFCHSFASSAVTLRCDLSRSGYLNSLRAAVCSFISFTSLACQFLLTKAHLCLFTQNLPLTDKDWSRKGMEGSPCSYHLGTLECLCPAQVLASLGLWASALI